VTNVFIYSGNWIKRMYRRFYDPFSLTNCEMAVFLGVGLLYLTWTPSERWKEQRTTFKSFPILTIFWIISLLYVIAAPFIPNTLPPAVPFYVVPTLGTSLLAIGTVYWVLWAKVLPLFGFHIQHEIEQLPDGSERVRYIVSSAPSPWHIA